MINTGPTASTYRSGRQELPLHLGQPEREIAPGDHHFIDAHSDASVLTPDDTRSLLEERLTQLDLRRLQKHYGRVPRVAALIATRLAGSQDGVAPGPQYDFVLIDGGSGASDDAALVYVADSRPDVHGPAGSFAEFRGQPTNVLPLNRNHPVCHIWNPKLGINRFSLWLNGKGDYFLATPSLHKFEAKGGYVQESDLGQSVYVQTPRVDRVAEARARAARKLGPVISFLGALRPSGRAA